MGQGKSILSCKNDFELAIRATKELEWLLETHFNAPTGKQHGLHDKITAVALPENIKKRMRYLVTVRNALVHDRTVNAIKDRASFLKGFAEVESQLKGMLPKKKSSCIIA